MKIATMILPMRLLGLEYESDEFFGFDFYELPGIISKNINLSNFHKVRNNEVQFEIDLR